MANTPEGVVKKAIKAYLKTLPECWWVMPVSNGMGTMGTPDFLVCYMGWFIAPEAKAPGKEKNTTPLQERAIDGINAAGGIAFVTSGLMELKAVIAGIDFGLSRSEIVKLVGIERKLDRA